MVSIDQPAFPAAQPAMPRPDAGEGGASPGPSWPVPWPVRIRDGVPDYRAIARQLAHLSDEAARHARATGNRRYDRLARNLDDCAGAILNDLDRSRGA